MKAKGGVMKRRGVLVGCLKADGYTQPIWPLSSYRWTILRCNANVSVLAYYNHGVRHQLLVIIIFTEV